MATLAAASLVAAPAGVHAATDLVDTAWASDPDKDCFVMGLELRANGKAGIVDTEMDVLTGSWTLSGTKLNATLYLDENHPPLVFSGDVDGDTMNATYIWNEGTDAGPDREECEFRRLQK